MSLMELLNHCNKATYNSILRCRRLVRISTIAIKLPSIFRYRAPVELEKDRGLPLT